jgi:hypothetical protein
MLRRAGLGIRYRGDSVASPQALPVASARLRTFRNRSYASEFQPSLSEPLPYLGQDCSEEL